MSFDFDQLAEEIDLEAWLDSQAIDYKRAGGANLNLRECVFCGDDRWRVYISAENKRGICFHGDCNRAFNLFSFARQHLNCDTSKTMRHFEDYSGRFLGRAKPAPRPEKKAEVGWVMPLNLALPTEDGSTHPYLTDRKVLPETQAHFDLRWCEDGGYDYETMDGTIKTMWFGKRILLPIRDLDGSIVSFVGRDASGKAAIRYLFPPALPSAGSFLYGGEHLPGVKHLVLGEGPFDAVAIHQAINGQLGFADAKAAGTFGISVGRNDPKGCNDQMGRLMRLKGLGLERVTFLWDGEAGALREALGGAESIVSQVGVAVSIGLLPKGTDPSEVDTRTIRDAIETSTPFSRSLKLRWTLSSPYK